MMERERLDADVLIVGAGPARLGCALHLARLIEKTGERFLAAMLHFA